MQNLFYSKYRYQGDLNGEGGQLFQTLLCTWVNSHVLSHTSSLTFTYTRINCCFFSICANGSDSIKVGLKGCYDVYGLGGKVC